MTVGSTLVYAGLGLLTAARVFGTDAILYGGEAGWGDLLRRREVEPGRVPSVPAALVTALAAAVALTVVGRIPGEVARTGAALGVAASAGLLLILFGGLPWLAARLGGADRTATFALRAPPVPAVIGAGLLGLSLWPLVYELLIYSGAAEDAERFAEQAGALKDRLAAVPLPILIVCLAVVPAFAEEWCFRGLVLGSLRPRVGAAWGGADLRRAVRGVPHGRANWAPGAGWRAPRCWAWRWGSCGCGAAACGPACCCTP